MKATILAKLFDELNRQQIPFSVDEVQGQSYTEVFGVKANEKGADKEADGMYLQIWATKNSLCDDIVKNFLEKNMKQEFTDGTIEIFNAPTNDVDNDDWLYIIKIED